VFFPHFSCISPCYFPAYCILSCFFIFFHFSPLSIFSVHILAPNAGGGVVRQR
jgi:hypothetical protein